MHKLLAALCCGAALAALPARGADVDPLHASNETLDLRIQDNGSFVVTDKRNRRQWKQQAFGPAFRLLAAKSESGDSVLQLLDEGHGLTIGARVALSGSEVDITVTAPPGKLDASIPYPLPFASAKDLWLVVPMNEGILYPADDESIKPFQLVAYSGHGISMPWYGLTDPVTGAGIMSVLATPDDARIEITRAGSGPLTIRPLWEPSRGALGYPRRMRCIFFDKGGYVAQAKRYREIAKRGRLLRTLAEKRAANPNVDLLIGAVNVWYRGNDRVELCRELKAAGMDHVLWSAGGSAEDLRAINEMGYLTSRYDIYQDVWPPDAPKNLKHDGWPDDLVWLPNGEWMKGWASHQTAPDGTKKIWQGGVISSPRQLARAKQQMPEDLKTKPYKCRFIDTTTASPFREDYNPAHPLSRSDDRKYKMQLLEFCSREMKLVTGSETGLDAAVPFVHYFEGMLSLGRYRLPDAGRDTLAYKKPTPDFLKFQVGHYYRVPLWELVYHDCVVSQWYWGDYNNKAPEVWDRRDLFNILYGTPPMFMFNREMWDKDKPRFAQSYANVCPSARQLGYTEMTGHAFLTSDHSVQRTTWAGGAAITVNFGDRPYALSGGRPIPPLGWLREPAGP